MSAYSTIYATREAVVQHILHLMSTATDEQLEDTLNTLNERQNRPLGLNRFDINEYQANWEAREKLKDELREEIKNEG